MLYPVSELFTSIQGEGFHTGTPAHFIRLAGCNLNCEWCDTDHSERERLTPEQIVERLHLKRSEVTMVVLTGGEPTIHDLVPLLKTLREQNKIKVIAIETNGTHVEKWLEYREFDVWITLSPKTPFG